MRRRPFVAAAVLALAMGTTLAARPAWAEAPPIPDDVSVWFRDVAPGVVASLSSARPDVPPDPVNGPLVLPFRSSVGKPVPVMIWGDEFLQAADPTADMLVPRGDWVAPISAQGQPLGVMTVCRTDAGGLTWRVDPDAEQAAALMAARPSDVIASNGSDGLFIVTGNTARQYGLSHWSIAPVVGSLKQLQAAVLAHQAQLAEVTKILGEVPTGGGALNFGQYVRDHPEGPITAPITVIAPWRIAAATLGGALVVGASCAAMYARGRREESAT